MYFCVPQNASKGPAEIQIYFFVSKSQGRQFYNIVGTLQNFEVLTSFQALTIRLPVMVNLSVNVRPPNVFRERLHTKMAWMGLV